MEKGTEALIEIPCLSELTIYAKLPACHCSAGFFVQFVGQSIRSDLSQLRISLFGFADVAIRILRLAKVEPAGRIFIVAFDNSLKPVDRVFVIFVQKIRNTKLVKCKGPF